MGQSMYFKIDESFRNHMVIFWANLSRLNNLLIIVNITMFFLTGLIAQGYFYTFYSIGCFAFVAILTILPVPFIGRLWFYLLNLIVEFEGVTIIGRLPDNRSIFLNNLKGKPLDPELPEIEPVCDAIEQAWI